MRTPVSCLKFVEAPLAVLVFLIGLSTAHGQLWINEVLFNPETSNDVPHQFFELRGTPNQMLTNTYFVAVEGDTNGEPGTIADVFDLTGVCIGGNGFLTVLQNSNSYSVNAAATKLVNTNGAGFGSGSGSSIKHRGKNGQVAFQSASITFFLLQANQAPSLGDDIDADNDGLPDGVVFSQWAVFDSVGVLDSDGFGDIAYGAVNFRRSDSPGKDATARTGAIISIPFTPGYIARIKNSTGSTAADWMAAGKLSGAGPRWKFPATNVSPPSLARMPFGSLGTGNFGAPRIPGVLASVPKGGLKLIEGGQKVRYTLGLNVPARGGINVRATAPDGIELSADGRTFGPSGIVKITGPPKPLFLRAAADGAVGASEQVLKITHTVISSTDPLNYPLGGTIVPDVAATVIGKERIVLNELKVNPPGPEDAPFEFVELQGTPNAALQGVKLLVIDGDLELNPGTALSVIDLSGERVGSNGLLLLLGPGSPYTAGAGTRVVVAPKLGASGGALHNGSVTFLLVHTRDAIIEGTDLDAGNNGVLEKLPAGSSILDSIAWRKGANDQIYSPATLDVHGGVPDAASRFKGDDRPNTSAAWFGGKLAGTNAESLAYDESRASTNYPVGTGLSPGVINRMAPRISALPPYSGTIGDPTEPPIRFTISDTEVPVKFLEVSAESSDTNVVPAGNLTLGGTGGARTLVIKAARAGYSAITIHVSDGELTSDRTFLYAASADERGGGRFHTGASDGSAVYPIDARWMLVGDDENQTIRVYSRSNSGPPVKGFDLNPFLGLTDLYDNGTPKELDIEASTHVGSRIYWLGSHSHAGDFDIATNRARVFATDISGNGTNCTLNFAGRYDFLKFDLVNWDSHGEHGKGAFYYGLLDSSLPGVDPKNTNGTGFNMEGLAMAPNSTTAAYLGFRAPLVPPATRAYALIVLVTNFSQVAIGNGPPGSTRFGQPVELNLGGRGIRSIEGTGTNYLLVAGPPGPGTGIPPSDFKLFTWSGSPADQPQQRSADLSGLNPEAIVALPALPWTSNSMVQLVSDNGTTVLYGDGIQAKHLTVPEFKKCRSDWVRLGAVVTPQPFVRHAVKAAGGGLEVTWHAVEGRTYRIQSKANMSDPVWIDLPGEVTATNAITTRLVFPDPARGFFRVRAVE